MKMKSNIHSMNPPPRKALNRETLASETVHMVRADAEIAMGYLLAEQSRVQNMAAQTRPIIGMPGNPNPAMPSKAKKFAFASEIRPPTTSE